MNIRFGDLSRQYKSIKKEIDSAVADVLDSGWFVLGKNVELFERKFAEYCSCKYAVGVGSGTEALHLSILSCNIENNDEIITVPNTAVPTVSAVSFANAIPVFVDINEQTFTMDPSKIESRITRRTKAIIPVHLFGHPADMDPIIKIAKKYNIKVIEDACQSHGSLYKSIKTGTIGDIGCFSFYPSKNLGCFGDGGMVVTNNKKIYEKIKLLRNYGQKKRYYHSIKGFNSRLDEIQAAVLLVKLRKLDEWNDMRRKIAKSYNDGIANPLIIKPIENKYTRHNYHLYVIRTKNRDRLRKYMKDKGIETLIHYPLPIYLQEAYKFLNIRKGRCPVAEMYSNEIVSLPIYPELKMNEIRYIIDVINKY